jgi:hypothetical protein
MQACELASSTPDGEPVEPPLLPSGSRCLCAPAPLYHSCPNNPVAPIHSAAVFNRCRASAVGCARARAGDERRVPFYRVRARGTGLGKVESVLRARPGSTEQDPSSDSQSEQPRTARCRLPLGIHSPQPLYHMQPVLLLVEPNAGRVTLGHGLVLPRLELNPRTADQGTLHIHP